MTRPTNLQLAAALILVLAAALGILACWFGAPTLPFGVCSYLVLSLIPGAAVYRLASKDPEILEEVTAAVALSPVLTAAATAAVMLAGVPVRETVTLVLFLVSILGVVAVFRPGSLRCALNRRQAIALFALLVVVSAAVIYLPVTREWWRQRSDAWFHAAVIAQIADYGIPPEDPYMVGFPLQYMWFYHVFALALSKASGINPFMVMALINVPALVGLALGGFLLSSIFRRTFSHNFAATLTVIFGMNAAVWLFIPLKLVAAFSGEVRGAEEIARLFSLRPFDVLTVRRIVQVGIVQEFLLDKFMVGTAFSLGLCLMAVLWWAAIKYLTSAKREYLVTSFLAAFGIVAFHTVVGTVMFGGVAGGLLLLVLMRRRLKAYDAGPIWRLLGAMVLCGILLVPYLYSVNHAKTGSNAFPLGFSALQMLGIAVSSALVIFLAAFQWRRMFRAGDVTSYFLVSTTAVIIAICAVLKLPGANAYDKLPFVVFFPLAVVGGWTIAEYSGRAPTARGRKLRYVFACLAAFAPLNIFMFAGYYHTAPILKMNTDEKKIGAWIRAETQRESIMIDSSRSCFILVAGPRRYYLGAESFAKGWGYDPAEIDKRKAVKTDIFAPGAFEPLTLETLGAMPYPVYVIVRSDDPRVDTAKFGEFPSLFRRMFGSGPITVFEVDRKACLSAARAPGDGG